jgi:hypothetical protein
MLGRFYLNLLSRFRKSENASSKKNLKTVRKGYQKSSVWLIQKGASLHNSSVKKCPKKFVFDVKIFS